MAPPDRCEKRDFSGVIDALEPIFGELERIGGSGAQLDLVVFTLLQAYVSADRLNDARRMLSVRRRSLSDVVRGTIGPLQVTTSLI
jgi:hypothetical protein